ncbi:MAG: SRPBCC domain-containing protein [Chloroflexota bacterium]|nr:SRPBCC domain-containing protein [Chloroflexota bacterium]
MVSSLLKGIYREVVEPERLVYTQFWDEYPDHEMLNTDTFAEYGGKTMHTTRARFASVADRDLALKMGMAEGWEESLDRLEKHLAKYRTDGAGKSDDFGRDDGDH